MKYYTPLVIIPFLAACSGEQAGESKTTSVDGMSADRTIESNATENKNKQISNPAKSRSRAPDLPYGIAHYPEAEYLSASLDITSKGGKNPVWYQYDTMDDPAEVLEFYKGEAEKAGFTINSENTEPAFREISLKTTRPGGGLMNVNTIGDKGKKLLINLHISEDN